MNFLDGYLTLHPEINYLICFKLIPWANSLSILISNVWISYRSYEVSESSKFKISAPKHKM